MAVGSGWGELGRPEVGHFRDIVFFFRLSRRAGQASRGPQKSHDTLDASTILPSFTCVKRRGWGRCVTTPVQYSQCSSAKARRMGLEQGRGQEKEWRRSRDPARGRRASIRGLPEIDGLDDMGVEGSCALTVRHLSVPLILEHLIGNRNYLTALMSPQLQGIVETVIFEPLEYGPGLQTSDVPAPNGATPTSRFKVLAEEIRGAPESVLVPLMRLLELAVDLNGGTTGLGSDGAFSRAPLLRHSSVLPNMSIRGLRRCESSMSDNADGLKRMRAPRSHERCHFQRSDPWSNDGLTRRERQTCATRWSRSTRISR